MSWTLSRFSFQTFTRNIEAWRHEAFFDRLPGRRHLRHVGAHVSRPADAPCHQQRQGTIGGAHGVHVHIPETRNQETAFAAYNTCACGRLNLCRGPRLRDLIPANDNGLVSRSFTAPDINNRDVLNGERI
jgi:hypothetical protein